MSFRTRLALAAAGAVALAVVIASVVVFVVVREQLLGQVDNALRTRSQELLQGRPGPGGGEGVRVEGGHLEIPGQQFGSEADYVQAVPVAGSPLLSQNLSRPLPVSGRTRGMANGSQTKPYFSNVHVSGIEFRVLTQRVFTTDGTPCVSCRDPLNPRR